MNKMNYGCEGLCVVISGGTSGIGLAAAQRFLADGARVYIWGAPRSAARRLCVIWRRRQESRQESRQCIFPVT